MLYSNNGNSPCVVLTNETFTVYAEISLRLKFRSKTQIKNQLQADGNLHLLLHITTRYGNIDHNY